MKNLLLISNIQYYLNKKASSLKKDTFFKDRKLGVGSVKRDSERMNALKL